MAAVIPLDEKNGHYIFSFKPLPPLPPCAGCGPVNPWGRTMTWHVGLDDSTLSIFQNVRSLTLRGMLQDILLPDEVELLLQADHRPNFVLNVISEVIKKANVPITEVCSSLPLPSVVCVCVCVCVCEGARACVCVRACACVWGALCGVCFGTKQETLARL